LNSKAGSDGDRRRKSKVHRAAAPEETTTDESRRLGSKAGLESQLPAKVGSEPEGDVGGLVKGASQRLAQRQSRKVDRRRKSTVGTMTELEGWSKTKVGDWRKGGWRVDRRRKSRVDTKATPEG